jgi:hypothetical protein
VRNGHGLSSIAATTKYSPFLDAVRVCDPYLRRRRGPRTGRVGGGMATPRKSSAASMMMATPSCVVARIR